MNHLRTVRILVAMLVCILSAPGVRAQHVETRVENAEVVYVEGNDVVVKLTDGEVRQFEIPDTCKFTDRRQGCDRARTEAGDEADGNDYHCDSSQVGRYGGSDRSRDGVENLGSSLIITTPDGENKMYRVPSGGRSPSTGKRKHWISCAKGIKSLPRS